MVEIPLQKERLNAEPGEGIQKNNPFKHLFNNCFINLVVLFNVFCSYFEKRDLLAVVESHAN